MSMRRVILAAVVLVVLGKAPIHAQQGSGLYGGPAAPDTSAASGSPEEGGTPPVTSTVLPAQPSPWVLGTCPQCCGPLTDGNPAKTELYLRSGVATISGDGPLARSLGTGWTIQGGGRELFFNRAGDAAWTVDLGIMNINNEHNNNTQTVTLLNINTPSPGFTGRDILPSVQATPRNLNQTFVGLGGGREWYLFGGAANTRDNPHPGLWRIGIDGGGRWGTSRLETFEVRHRTDTLGAVYLAAHTDVDIPCGCCVFQVGLRYEWDYVWSDILQIQNKSDVMVHNFLFNVGFRY
jgi:hypothetical protein